MIAITLCIFILLLILGVPIAIGTGAAALLYPRRNDDHTLKITAAYEGSRHEAKNVSTN